MDGMVSPHNEDVANAVDTSAESPVHDTLAGALHSVIQNSPNVQASARMLSQVLANAMNSLGRNIECLMMDNGGVFVGDVVLNKPQGKGVLIYSGRDKDGRVEYRGEFISGKRHGLGTMVWADGAKYEGEWRTDKIVGFAEETYADKSVYKGQFLDETRHGLGEYRMSQGLHAGGWEEGLCHGVGFRTKENGSTSWGLYERGVLVEERPNGNDLKEDLAEVIWHTKCIVEATRKLSDRLRPLDAIAAFVRHSVANDRTPTPSPGPSPMPPTEESAAEPKPQPDEEATVVEAIQPPAPQELQEPKEPAAPTSQDAATETDDAGQLEQRPTVATVETSCQTDQPEQKMVAEEGVQTEAPEPEVQETPQEEVEPGGEPVSEEQPVADESPPSEEKVEEVVVEEAPPSEEKVEEVVAEESPPAEDKAEEPDEVVETAPIADDAPAEPASIQDETEGKHEQEVVDTIEVDEEPAEVTAPAEEGVALAEEAAVTAPSPQPAADPPREAPKDPPKAKRPPKKNPPFKVEARPTITAEPRPTPPMEPRPQPSTAAAPPLDPKPPFVVPGPKRVPSPRAQGAARADGKARRSRSDGVAEGGRSRGGAGGRRLPELQTDAEALEEMHLPMRERMPGSTPRRTKSSAATSPYRQEEQTMWGSASPYKTSPRFKEPPAPSPRRRPPRGERPEWDAGGVKTAPAHPQHRSDWRRVRPLHDGPPYRAGAGVGRLDTKEHPWLEGADRPRAMGDGAMTGRSAKAKASREREAVLQLLGQEHPEKPVKIASRIRSDPNSIWDDIQPVQKEMELPPREKGLLKAYFPLHYDQVCGPKPPIL